MQSQQPQVYQLKINIIKKILRVKKAGETRLFYYITSAAEVTGQSNGTRGPRLAGGFYGQGWADYDYFDVAGVLAFGFDALCDFGWQFHGADVVDDFSVC